MRKIIITGGGFRRTSLTHHFLEAGGEVHVVDSIERYTGGIDPADGWPIFEPRDHKNFQAAAGYGIRLSLHLMVGGRLMKVPTIEIPAVWRPRKEGESQNTFLGNFACLAVVVRIRFMSRASILKKAAQLEKASGWPENGNFRLSAKWRSA
jgi:hypothetical protein